MNKTIRIKPTGCDIYPHGTLWEVTQSERGYHPVGRIDLIPENWSEEIQMPNEFFQDSKGRKHLNKKTIFGITSVPFGVSLNLFRNMGYLHDTSRSGKFTNEEYEEFENYLKENKIENFIVKIKQIGD